MIVFRLCKSMYARDLSGRGAELAGGRWNSKGVALVYTSATRSLCLLEVAIHTPLGILPKDYSLVHIELPDKLAGTDISAEKLPHGWRDFPPPAFTQEIGDRFVKEARHPYIKVPSAIVPGDFNYLLNPLHAEFHKVTIHKVEPFDFDKRLFM
jgi:RES domain-containing protein